MTIACTLDASQLPQRRDDWGRLVATATRVDADACGTRLTFRRDVDVAAIAALVAAENDCCRFFTFTLQVTADDVQLHVAAPAEARRLIDGLLGATG